MCSWRLLTQRAPSENLTWDELATCVRSSEASQGRESTETSVDVHVDEAQAQVLMSVALGDGDSAGEIAVLPDSSPARLASEFIAEHKLDADAFADALVAEVSATLLDVRAMEIARVTRQRDAARTQLATVQATLEARSGVAPGHEGDSSAVQIARARQAQAVAERRAGELQAQLTELQKSDEHTRLRRELADANASVRAGPASTLSSCSNSSWCVVLFSSKPCNGV